MASVPKVFQIGVLSIFLCCLFCITSGFAQMNLSLLARVISSDMDQVNGGKAIDGDVESCWQSGDSSGEKWLQVILEGASEIRFVKISMQDADAQMVSQYALQTYINGRWEDQVGATEVEDQALVIQFDEVLINDRLRLNLFAAPNICVQEFEIHGVVYEDPDATSVKGILTNQSGYNLNKPKRFTAPEAADHTPFHIEDATSGEVRYQGEVVSRIGDFSSFNPPSENEFVIRMDTSVSYPFRIGPYWLERVTYQNMIDFMIGARHYVGTTDLIRSLSWAWRDGDFFNWAEQSLVALYLSNPQAFERLPRRIGYVPNESFFSDYKGKWGALEPYDSSAPDIVKLIHWDADVKISQGLEHEMQKASTEAIENPDDTFLVQNSSARKQKLEEQLAAYKKQLDGTQD